MHFDIGMPGLVRRRLGDFACQVARWSCSSSRGVPPEGECWGAVWFQPDAAGPWLRSDGCAPTQVGAGPLGDHEGAYIAKGLPVAAVRADSILAERWKREFPDTAPIPKLSLGAPILVMAHGRPFRIARVSS